MGWRCERLRICLAIRAVRPETGTEPPVSILKFRRVSRNSQISRCREICSIDSTHSRSIRFASWRDTDDRNQVACIVDSIDDAVGSSSGAVSIGQWRFKSVAHTMRVIRQRPDDELVRCERHRLRQGFSELTAGSR
jgi:hypothetical protein